MSEPKKTESFAGNVMKYSIATYLGFGISGAALIIKGVLPAESYAVPASFMAYTMSLMNVGMLGLDQSLLRFYHEPPAGSTGRSMFAACTRLSVLVMLLAGGIGSIFFAKPLAAAFGLGASGAGLVPFLFLNAALYMLVRYLNVLLRLENNVRAYTTETLWMQACLNLIYLLPGFVTQDARAFVLGAVCSFAGVAVFYWRRASKGQTKEVPVRGLRPYAHIYRAALPYGIVLAPAAILIPLYRAICLSFLGNYAPAAEQGSFDFAYTLAQLVTTIQAGFSTYWGPYVYAHYRTEQERIGRILQMHANHREDIECCYAGDIAAVVGLKNSTTGDTLCDEKHPIILESMEFPEPVIRVAIEPKTKAGQEKMGLALVKLAEEDPTFKTYTDEETGQTIIAGMGELHLEIIVDRLLREFKVEANVGAPQVAYKETIKKSVEQDTKYARQSGGKGQYGHVRITVEPNEPGKGYEFLNEITGGVIPKEYIPAVDAGIQGAMQAGVLAGYPVVDVKVHLTFGSYHEVDSSEMAFKIAGSMAFKEACRKATPCLLEPMMKVSVIVPDEYLGNVIGDLNSRRGQIIQLEARPGAQQIDALVPLSEMFGYATDLRSRTQGRGQYSMEPHSYVEIPKSIAEKIIAERGRKDD